MSIFDREHYYRDLLAKQVGGRTEVTLPFGRADVMTDTMVWEVEPATRYPAGVRQALEYGAQTGLQSAIATYGPHTLAVKVFKRLAKLPAPGVELWWFYDRRFVPIKTAEQAGALTNLGVTGQRSLELPRTGCEVIWQEDGKDGAVHQCDERPIMYSPMRLCEAHAAEVLETEGLVPNPVNSGCCRTEPNRCPGHTWTAAFDLKKADDLTGVIERIAWPHLDPDSRDLIFTYLIEIRSLLWHAALEYPGGAEAFGDDEDEDAA